MDVKIKLLSVVKKDATVNFTFPGGEFPNQDKVIHGLPVAGGAQEFIDAATKHAKAYVAGLLAEKAKAEEVMSEEVNALVGKSKTIIID